MVVDESGEHATCTVVLAGNALVLPPPLPLLLPPPTCAALSSTHTGDQIGRSSDIVILGD